MCAESWTAELATERHLGPIRELFLATHHHLRSEAFDRWKLFGGEFGDSLSVVAMASGRCVGLYAILRTPMILDGRRVLGAQSVDTMTHPDFRGRGMFVSLARACYEEADRQGVELLYGLPNQNSYPGFIKHLGWNHIDDVTRWVRPLALPRRLPRAVTAVANPLVQAVTGLGRITATIGLAVAAIPACSDDQKPSKMQSCVEKSSKWLAWRYASESGSNFQSVTIGPSENPDAAIVFNMMSEGDVGSTHNASTYRIMEWLGRSGKDREIVLRQLIKFAARRGGQSITYMTNDPDKTPLLERNFFFERGKLPLIVRFPRGESLLTRTLSKGDLVIGGGDLD